MAFIAAALMALLIPGAGPPPTRMPIRRLLMSSIYFLLSTEIAASQGRDVPIRHPVRQGGDEADRHGAAGSCKK
jgi:hypothetical protein